MLSFLLKAILKKNSIGKVIILRKEFLPIARVCCFEPKGLFLFVLAILLYLNSSFFERSNVIEGIDLNQNVADKPVTLVVSPPVFHNSLKPWIDYRQSQGHEVFLLSLAKVQSNGSVDMGVVTDPIFSPEQIRAKILNVAQQRKIEAIVLVGDGAPTQDAKYGWRDVVPAARVRASVVQTFGSEEYLATDSYYADLDDDGIPDVPIGRFSVETPEELDVLVSKIVKYETTPTLGNWTRRVNIFAGPNGLDLRVIGSKPGEEQTGTPSVNGISALVDSVVNSMARKMFAEFLPQEFSVSLTQCSPQSLFCPYPPDFSKVFLERINEDALFFVYMGHGRVLGLDRYQPSEYQDYGIFEIDDCKYLNAQGAPPVAFFFACYTGAYDANCKCLAEQIVLSPNGPVAVYAASRLTAPYGMCALGSSLMQVAFDSDLDGVGVTYKRLGDIVLQAQREAAFSSANKSEEEEDEDDEFDVDLVFEEDVADSSDATQQESRADSDSEANASNAAADVDNRLDALNQRLEKSLQDAEEYKRKNSSFRQTLDRTAAIFDPTASRLNEQIRDHIAEFNLLGDPLLRVRFPQRIRINSDDIGYSTKEITVTGTIPNLNDRESIVQGELLLADFRTQTKKPKRASVFRESAENQEEYRRTYTSANNFIVDAHRTQTSGGKFEVKLEPPKNFSGESIVRIVAFDGKNYYVGSKRVTIRPYTEKVTEE